MMAMASQVNRRLFYSTGLRMFSLVFGFVAIILEIIAHSTDLHYESQKAVTPNHDLSEDRGILLNEDFIKAEYFDKTRRNLWYEPLAIALIVTSLCLYMTFVFLTQRLEIIAKSIFLCAIFNGVQIYFSLLSALLIYKSYNAYDTGYFQSFVRGVKINYYGLALDGYMRLYCYNGYLKDDLSESDYHFDERIYKHAITVTDGFRENQSICQDGNLKLYTVLLLILAATFCGVEICLACCCDFTNYGTKFTEISKVHPEFVRAEASFKREGFQGTEKIKKSENNNTEVTYSAEGEKEQIELEFSVLSTEAENDLFQFDFDAATTNEEKSKQ